MKVHTMYNKDGKEIKATPRQVASMKKVGYGFSKSIIDEKEKEKAEEEPKKTFKPAD